MLIHICNLNIQQVKQKITNSTTTLGVLKLREKNLQKSLNTGNPIFFLQICVVTLFCSVFFIVYLHRSL